MKISPKSYFAAAAVFLQGSALLLNILLQDLRHEAWIAFLVAAVISVFLLYYMGNEDIYTLASKKLGNRFGKILSIVYAVYFLLAASYNINLLSSFVSGYVLRETPRAAFAILFTVLCIYGAKNGYDNLLRLSFVFFAVALVSNTINVFLLRDKFNFTNFLPLSGMGFKGTITAATLLVLDASVFLCFARSRKNTVLGFISGTVFLLATILCNIGVLGSVISIYTWPTHEALRIINSGNTLARVETSSVFVMVAIMFFKVCLTLCAGAEGVKKITNINKNYIPTLLGGVIIFVVSLLIFQSGAEAMDWFRKYGAYIILPLGAVIPGVLKAITTKK